MLAWLLIFLTADGPSHREQVNNITSFLDGSLIYGSTAERAADLRAFWGGRLKLNEDGYMPYEKEGEDCNIPFHGHQDKRCYMAGKCRW